MVAIIETMKLMNPVYAGTAGAVTEICLDDGQFAEQGAVLMRVSTGRVAGDAAPHPRRQPGRDRRPGHP